MATSCPQFNSEVESVHEFIERFKVQCSDQLTAAGENELKRATVLVKALPVNVITDLQRRIKPVTLSAATYEDLISKLTSQYEVKKSVVGASVQFLNRKQSSSETIETYAKILNDLASGCRYKDCCRDRLLRDTFIAGLRANTIITGLLQDCEADDTKSFNDCIEKAKMLEQLTHDAQDIKPDTSFKVSASYSGSGRGVAVPNHYTCIRCGTKAKHYAKDCFAIKLTCNICHKQGHLAKVCKSKNFNHNNSRAHMIHESGEDMAPSQQRLVNQLVEGPPECAIARCRCDNTAGAGVFTCGRTPTHQNNEQMSRSYTGSNYGSSFKENSEHTNRSRKCDCSKCEVDSFLG